MKLLFSVLIILNTAFAFSQNMITDTTAEVVTYWKKGDIRNLEKTTTREKYVNDILVFKTTSVADIEVKVLEETDTIYVVEWLFKETRVNESEEEIAKRLAEMSKNLKVVYKAKDIGVYETLLNYEFMQNFFAKAMDNLKEQYGIDTVGKQIYGIVKQIFASEEAVEASFSKDIKLYHFPYGAEYLINEVIEEPIVLPNPLTGEPVNALLHFKMTDLDFPSMSCTIEGTMKITEEESKAYIKDFIEKLKASGAEKIPSEHEIPAMEVDDYYKHVIELLDGWVTHVSHIRTVKSGIVKQVDTTTIILKDEMEK